MRESLGIMAQCLLLLQSYNVNSLFDFSAFDNKVVPPSRAMMKYSMSL